MSELVTEEHVLSALQQVEDPELGVSIVDLGLVYSIEVVDHGAHIAMTMTSPSCPLTDLLKKEVSVALRTAFPDLASIVVEIVWEPQWSPMMMSWQARQQLG